MKRFTEPAGGERLKADAVDKNFSDLHAPLRESGAVIDAARCLYCYEAPCVTACPTGIDIPKFIHQIRTGHVEGAARTILSENIMGGTCARACPTEVLCEEVCVVNRSEGKPVNIGALQRFAVDSLIEKHGAHPFDRAPASGKRVAVVGAGPAGLSFAHRAAMLGHDVTVFDRREKAGGLNEYGIAAYKMTDDFAQREVAFLLDIGGINVVQGQELGRDFEIEGLRREFDAVFIGVGLARSNAPGVPGENLAGVSDALSFIEQVRQHKDKSSIPVGRDVVIIGGGNTAIDAGAQAKALGARNVTLVYRRGRDDMGATPFEQEFAAANGVSLIFRAAPKAFLGVGRVESARFAETVERGGALEETGREFEIAADLVLVAVGQKLDNSPFASLRLERERIWVDDQYQTSLPGVYAGGDCIRRGEDLTVRAVEDGKRAAIFADAHLRAGAEGKTR